MEGVTLLRDGRSAEQVSVLRARMERYAVNHASETMALVMRTRKPDEKAPAQAENND